MTISKMTSILRSWESLPLLTADMTIESMEVCEGCLVGWDVKLRLGSEELVPLPWPSDLVSSSVMLLCALLRVGAPELIEFDEERYSECVYFCPLFLLNVFC